jgi:L-cysteine S-thiosulfotransferase
MSEAGLARWRQAARPRTADAAHAARPAGRVLRPPPRRAAVGRLPQGLLVLGLSVAAAATAAAGAADGIDAPLTAVAGDPTRGRAIVASRQQGLCLLCHSGPFPEERFQGNVASDLAGAGSRWTVPQLRLRIVDSRRVNPDSVMPAFHRSTGLQRVGAAWQDKPVLDAQQVEDVVAFLATLRD